jgi:hypothetical protein
MELGTGASAKSVQVNDICIRIKPSSCAIQIEFIKFIIAMTPEQLI